MQEQVLVEKNGPVKTGKGQQTMKKVLISNMPSSTSMYGKSKIKVAVVPRPAVAMATLAACCLEQGIDTRLIDLSLLESEGKNPGDEMEKFLDEYKPDYVCFSFTTPLFNECCDYAKFVKEKLPSVTLIAGGVHPSIFPEEVLEKSVVDIAVTGEGDTILPEVILADKQIKKLKEVKGITFRDKDGGIIKTHRRPGIEDLDSLPLPAWNLLPVEKYKMPKIMAKKNPVATMETSRGCLAACTYCNKTVFGRQWKFKSAKRVVDEFEYTKKCGFNEIHIWDDMFSTDLDRLKDICDIIIERKIKIVWRLDCGIRIDSVDKELFQKLKKAGCYCVSFGFESGSQKILDHIRKGLNIKEAYKATEWAREAGLETIGFFMFGLPGETEETMNETIELAKKLDLDYAKVTLATPFPGTGFYGEVMAQGRLRSKDWSAYNFHTPSRVWEHENLRWDTMQKYYNKFYKKYYFRPSYLIKRLIRDIKTGNIISDIQTAFQTFVK
tara:strand:+ start:7049 stop:8536 length:1488 start_codon:yes stop_codon:yes gene_type:complete